MDNYLEEFGKIFIKEVRDRTIDVLTYCMHKHII